MLKLPLGQIKGKQQKGQFSANLQRQPFKGNKFNNYFKTYKNVLNVVISDRIKATKPINDTQHYQSSVRYNNHKKSNFSSQQYSEVTSQKLLRPYASQQKSKKQEKEQAKERKSLNKVMIAFGDPYRKETKEEDQMFLLSRVKKNNFNLSIFSERQKKIGQRTFYYAGQRHRQLLSKLSKDTQNRLKTQIKQALVIKKYKNKDIKSLTVPK